MNMFENIKNNLKESSDYYNWKDDIFEVGTGEENDDIWYAVAENMCETDPESYGDDPLTVMSNIISLWGISKNSRLYNYLLKWYGSKEKLMKRVRDAYETSSALYFVTGCGYSIFDADLLGGNADGTKAKAFDKFVDSLVEEDTEEYETRQTIGDLLDEIDNAYTIGEIDSIAQEFKDEYNRQTVMDEIDAIIAEYGDVYEMDEDSEEYADILDELKSCISSDLSGYSQELNESAKDKKLCEKCGKEVCECDKVKKESADVEEIMDRYNASNDEVEFYNSDDFLDNLGSDAEIVAAMYKELGPEFEEDDAIWNQVMEDIDNEKFFGKGGKFILKAGDKVIVGAGRDSANMPIVYEDKEYVKESSLKEGRDGMEGIWGAVCGTETPGRARKIDRYFDKHEPNRKYNKFGIDHSLIMGAARNGNYNTVDQLISKGESIRDEEADEFEELMSRRNKPSPSEIRKKYGMRESQNLKESSNVIWSSETTIDDYDPEFLQERYQEYLENFSDSGEEDMAKDFDEWKYDYVADDSYDQWDMKEEDLNTNIKPMIDKQINNDILIVSGDYKSGYPDFRPSGSGGKFLNSADDLMKWLQDEDRVDFLNNDGVLGVAGYDHDGTISGNLYTLPDDPEVLLKVAKATDYYGAEDSDEDILNEFKYDITHDYYDMSNFFDVADSFVPIKVEW